MRLWTWLRARERPDADIAGRGGRPFRENLRADGGEDEEGDEDDEGERDGSSEGEDDDTSENAGEADAADAKRSNVDVAEAGEATPADPKWEKPDLDDIPEFETGADEPVTTGGPQGAADDRDGDPTGGQNEDSTADRGGDPTAGMPNAARSPNDSRIKKEGTEGYVAAVELCARLPADVRLPEEAADLVPAAVEAELEEDIQTFTAAEFDNASPHVDTLEFVERDAEVWLRLRLGVAPAAFSDLDPDEIRTYALERLEGMF